MAEDKTVVVTLTNANTPYKWMDLLVAAGFLGTAALTFVKFRMPDANAGALVARCSSSASTVLDGTAWRSGEGDEEYGDTPGTPIDANLNYWITDTPGAKVSMTVRGR